MTKPRPIRQSEQRAADAAGEDVEIMLLKRRLAEYQRLLRAAIALAWSEAGTSAKLLNHPGEFEPWPQMDELLRAIDGCNPGWRFKVPPNA